jgi:CheY-like chemotaxis protein
MKTEKELNRDILQVTMKIEEMFPELSKYIEEMPVTISETESNATSIKNLEDYYNSLSVLMKSYSINHLGEIAFKEQKKTILLIEDTADILENLTEFLMLEGYKVIAADNGKTGLELAEKFLPDLIICDVLMPGMDGREVLRVLLDTVKIYEIPFIFSSSMSEKIDKAEALKLGADDYIVKPFDLRPLLKMIKTCIKSGSKRHVDIETSLIL